jgi:hypothetical protein
VDHIRSSIRAIYWIQKAIEFFSLRLESEHMTRRPLEYVLRHDFDISERARFRWGIVERVHASKPS